jgi:hypothetical protein
MNSLGEFLKRRFFSLILIIVGLGMAILAVQVITGVPGFTTFFIGAAILVTGLLIFIY